MKIFIIPVIIIILVVGGIFMYKQFSKNPIESIKSMSFGYSVNNAYLGNVQYDINCEEKCIATIKPEGVSEEDAKEVEITEVEIKELIDFLNEKKVYTWDGFQKSDRNVLDGNSFHFYLHEKNGKGISASGYMMYPKNYKEVRSKIDQFFESKV